MADKPVVAKKLKVSAEKQLPICPYGQKCYRKKPDHFKEYAHPKDGDIATSSSSSCGDSTKLPPCPFGATCYRQNLLHFAEFSHPIAVKRDSSDDDDDDDDSGNDTETCHSDDDGEDKKTSKKDGKTKSQGLDKVLHRGPSLVKSYSKMTEEERKELIKSAFKAKQELEKELKKTKKKMEKKEKELKTLQDEVNTGCLLVPGEKEALEGSDMVTFDLFPERSFKEGSAAQAHFRLAESQFYRLLSSEAGSKYRVNKVEYVVNPSLVKRFREAREALKAERAEKYSFPVLAFHGTGVENIDPIITKGFKVPGDKGFKHSTDNGYWGKGVYFSEYPSYSIGYIKGATKLLLCQILPGKVYNCTKLIHGQKLRAGYDSHTSPDKKELVIFNSHFILPCYVVHYGAAKYEFRYKKTVTELTPAELDKKYKAALKAAPNECFQSYHFDLSGHLCDRFSNIYDLIEKHHGHVLEETKKKCGLVNPIACVLVCRPYEYDKEYAKVKDAKAQGFHIVREEFLYETILMENAEAPLNDYSYV